MAKIIPNQSPQFCWAIAEASYENGLEKSNGFLRKHFPEAAVLEEETFRGWKIILVQKGDQLSVAFRGTQPWHNWIGNLYHDVFGAGIGTQSRMEKMIRQWENKYGGKVTLFSSHSGGAIFAAAVLKTEQIARVFFNPHKASHDETHWNFSTNGDELTRYNLISSKNPQLEILKYHVLGEGSHSLDHFEPYVKDLDWGHLLLTAQLPELPILPILQREALALSKDLEFRDIILGSKNLEIFKTDLRGKRKLIEEAENSKQFLRDFAAGAKVLATQIHDQMVRDHMQKEQFRNLREQNRELRGRGDTFREAVNRPSSVTSYAALAQKIQDTLHPQKAVGLVRKIEELTKSYSDQLQSITSNLKDDRDEESAIKEQFKRLDQLDQKQQKAYRKLLKTQRAIGKKYLQLERICAGFSFISSVIPEGKCAVSIISSTASSILQFATLSEQKEQAKQGRKHTANLQRNLKSKEQLAETSARNQASKETHLQAAIAKVGELMDYTQFVPSKYRENLQVLLHDLGTEVEENNHSIQEIEQLIQKNDDELKAKKDRIAVLEQKRKGKKSDEKRALDNERNNLESECANIETENRKLKSEKRELVSVNTAFGEQINKVEEERKKAENYSPFRDRVWEVIKAEDRRWNSEAKEAEEIRTELHNAFRLYAEARAFERGMARDLAEQGINLANCLGYRGDAIRALYAGYQLWDQIKYWREVALPGAKEAIARFNGNASAAIWANLGTCAAGYLIPALGTIVIGFQLWQAVQGLRASASPNEKTIHEMMMDEIKQKFRELDKSLKEVIHRRHDELLEAMGHQFQEIKEILNLTTEHLSDQIADFRRENTEQHAKTLLNLFVSGMSNRSTAIRQRYEGFSQEIHHLCRYYYREAVPQPSNSREFATDVVNRFTQILSSFQKDLSSSNPVQLGVQVEDLCALPTYLQNRDYTLYSTEVIATDLNINQKTPNWHHLLDLSESFIALVNMIAKEQQVQKVILANQKLKNTWLGICLELSESYEKFGPMQKQIAIQIQKMLELQCNFFNKMAERALQTSKFRAEFLKVLCQKTYAEFKWDSFKENLVGENRFALHRELTSAFPQRMLQLRDRITTLFLNSRLFSLDLLDKGRHPIYSLSPFAALFSLANRNPKKTFTQLVVERQHSLWHAAWNGIQTPEALITFENSTRVISTDTVYAPIYYLNKEAFAYLTGEIDHQLIMDLKMRQIVWMDPLESPPNYPLLLKIKISENGTTSSDRTPSPFFNVESVNQIKETQGSPKENYREVLTGLVEDYKKILHKLVEGQPVDSIEPLSPLAQGEVVLSSKTGQLPLIFPKELLRYLETYLNPTRRYAHALGEGFFAPRYEFSTSSRELCIHYEYIARIAPQNPPRKFVKFKVASFDPLTVESFRPDLLSQGADFDPSEFLLQAMYGSFVALGMPGKATRLFADFKQVAPDEQSFTGLYQLWRQYPDKALSYNSQDNREPADDLHFISEHLSPLPTEDYFKVLSSIEKQKKTLIENEKEYQKSFHLVTMLSNLFSSWGHEVLLKKLEDELGIFRPQRLNILYDLPNLESPKKEDVQLFIHDLLAIPSHHVRQSMAVQEQLYTIEDWIRSDGLDPLNDGIAISPYSQEDEQLDRLLDLLGPILLKEKKSPPRDFDDHKHP